VNAKAKGFQRRVRAIASDGPSYRHVYTQQNKSYKSTFAS